MFAVSTCINRPWLHVLLGVAIHPMQVVPISAELLPEQVLCVPTYRQEVSPELAEVTGISVMKCSLAGPSGALREQSEDFGLPVEMSCRPLSAVPIKRASRTQGPKFPHAPVGEPDPNGAGRRGHASDRLHLPAREPFAECQGPPQ